MAKTGRSDRNVEHSFSIVTPTYNANRWIRSCVASAADQKGVSVQHVVQDGLSSDGTAEYVTTEPRIEGESSADKGMYDAINRAWSKCRGDYVLHLNADEQLLPGALAAVGRAFQSRPDVDVVIGGTLVCNADGSLRFFRKALRPTLPILLTSHHPVQSCAVFLRRSSFADRKWLYDPSFRMVSDALLMIDIVEAKKKFALVRQFTSVFLMTGENISLSKSPTTYVEYAHQMSLAPMWMRLLRPLIKLSFQIGKMLKGHYSSKRIEYDLFVPGEGGDRRHFVVDKPSGVYRET